MADDEREVARLWRVHRTIHKLVRDRGFAVAEEEYKISYADFKAEYAINGVVDRARLNFFVQHADNPDDQLYVYYSDEKKVGIKGMRKFLNILEEKNIQRGILIYETSLTSSANKVIDATKGQYELEAFEEAELLVNITEHMLVPRHEVLTPEEKKELLLKYRLKENQLPRIQLADPVARYFGLKRGQVVKITRASETSGRYCSYRIAF